jgi:hypothetical protein
MTAQTAEWSCQAPSGRGFLGGPHMDQSPLERPFIQLAIDLSVLMMLLLLLLLLLLIALP